MDTIDQIDLRMLRAFEAVARLRSFSDAGRELGSQRAHISKLVAELESKIGAQLFRRTTRNVALTEFGDNVLAIIAPNLNALREGLNLSKADAGGISGLVRFSASQAFAKHFMLAQLPLLHSQHPALRIEGLLTDTVDDMIAKTLDFTVRLGPLPASQLIARHLGDLSVVLAASSTLFRTYKKPSKIEDIQLLPMIGFRIPSRLQSIPWIFQHKNNSLVIEPTNAIVTLDSIEGVAQLVRDCLGVAPIPLYLIEKEISSGAIDNLFPKYVLPKIPVHLCYVSKKLMTKRARVVIDHMASSISKAIGTNR